ncbi:short-chain dehydrogenase/reductase SDR (plasmid) [Haloterrigena turkmenica DSM 5511]|uniref:Short-chain dehydrogenase/reductase SDR n=1 Tax=Haloterrigena turkmenica (strain ATCC 51198 / DSM 5511 / JCM 9101 / NCIMB 13204 / VKM B-1734 / 4k) TaxID=543526 RepID=D2RZX5_HALTV|nr:glucose 1-dehydrogenase [Haloterrigena turkmenica]ADB62672.1 short-chain dehydrogenase/reductase SDR [Haloterrigena turkmenica DSM 5511]
MKLAEDKSTVITGAASGIGRATAKVFAEHGANVVVADVDVDGGNETVEAIEDDGGTATFVETNVADQDDVQNMIDTAVEEYGGLDVLYNNAGIDGPHTEIAEYDVDGFDQVVDVNLKGVFLGMKYGISAMLEDGGGSIVSTSSIGGVNAVEGYSGYGATKAGVSLMTKTAAVEYADQGIRANAVAPGLVNTQMVQNIIEEEPEMEEEFLAYEPMDGFSDPREIANAVLFLTSDLASRVTGVTLPVEGGFLASNS